MLPVKSRADRNRPPALPHPKWQVPNASLEYAWPRSLFSLPAAEVPPRQPFLGVHWRLSREAAYLQNSCSTSKAKLVEQPGRFSSIRSQLWNQSLGGFDGQQSKSV